MEQRIDHRLRDGILDQFLARPNASVQVDFIKFGIEKDVMGRDVIIPCLQYLFNYILVQHIFSLFATGLDVKVNAELLSMYGRISHNGMD